MYEPEDDEDWRTIDFRPAPPGWRLVRLAGTYWPSPTGYHLSALPGWLIQERCRSRGRVDEGTEPADRERRVVACEVDEWGALNELLGSDFWYVLGPGEPLPTAEEAATEQRRRDEARAERAAKASAAPSP